jgi:hypothetical protein
MSFVAGEDRDLVWRRMVVTWVPAHAAADAEEVFVDADASAGADDRGADR